MEILSFLPRAEQILRMDICFLESGFFQAGCKSSGCRLLYMLQGHLHMIAQGTDNLLSPGDIMLCTPQSSYTMYSDIGNLPQFLQVDFTSSRQELDGISWVKHPENALCNELLQQLLREYHSSDAYTGSMLYLLVNQLLIAMERSCQTSTKHSKEGAILMRALQHIGDHVRQRLSVPDIAHAAGVSPSYLTALFQKHLNISPGECVRRAKLQLSKELIREGKLTLTQIAATLEYSTVHHFSRQFKEKFGVTPSQYANTSR